MLATWLSAPRHHPNTHRPNTGNTGNTGNTDPADSAEIHNYAAICPAFPQGDLPRSYEFPR
jgi:hypothetical protein